ncbi:ATP-dependent RNA helicase DbpA [Thiomicrorhabdus xiamenensis]|uniref:ATP-dependent RNA helicase DbpA n=1 Tax=Thiomicrorhabdus xiamenensis TaxID=2739063 RepID=A0A7D4T947_9GAMM|nr:ATP-dependent RNA helicase DbpA [Thiomicrorhabdus xiamenensis]QKI88286.1 ATP-dependent RNA helicase DbpA [Thiomicrorhabdus xiamenensis]
MTHSSDSFSELALRPELLGALQNLNFTAMTPIQAQSVPFILNGDDLIAQAKTGSGKTVAFGLGLLQKLEPKWFSTQALVLCPTRELAEQVATEIRKLASQIENVKLLTLCGGTPFKPQAASLEYGAHIVVGTPGRVEDHVKRGTLFLDDLNVLVLDEADRMLEMGFEESLTTIIEQTPDERQSLLFSATFPDSIQQLAAHILQNPQHVKVESVHNDNAIRQHFYQVANEAERQKAVKLVLLAHQTTSAVVFCNTKREVQDLTDDLKTQGFSAVALHGDLEQRERDQTLIQFANQSATVLVATDVAARGLDIDSVEVVINYHLAHDPEVHIHRIGRTGRAGKSGFACSLISDKQNYKVALLEEALGFEIETEALPDDSVLMQRPIKAPMVTLQIDGGKKSKIRPGDILGALTGDGGIAGDQVGKIKVTAMRSYVAVSKNVSQQALNQLNHGKLKGRKTRARFLN